MEITFLGTSCMVPTKERNVSAIFVKYKSEGILLDCGEGTQRQMNIASINRNKVNKIFITHWHGDHVSGLIGLFQTMANKENNPVIEIYGPKETKKRIASMIETVIFDVQIDLKIHELKLKGVEKVYENEDLMIFGANLDHKVPCIGYSIVEKEKININKAYLKNNNIPEGPHLKPLKIGKSSKYGNKVIKFNEATYKVARKKMTYISDTKMCDNAIELGMNSDVLISEASYHSKLQEKAEEHHHMTTKDAALLANQANVKKLILTHISQRYKTTEELEEDAKIYFQNVKIAFDFMKVKL